MVKVLDIKGFPAFAAVQIGLYIFTVCGVQGQEATLLDYVTRRLKSGSSGVSKESRFQELCRIDENRIADRVFHEYGALFAATSDVKLPPTCIFDSATSVNTFQQKLDRDTHLFGNVEVELQETAMKHLKRAVDEAARRRLRITPLDGAIAGKRSYEDTVRIWNSRFYRALDFWVRRGRIGEEEAKAARADTAWAQIEKVIDWEAKDICFSTDFTRSIFNSVAPPGTSQHLSMLAFDVVEAADPRVREILNRHGWYQTIRTDQPHFTFLGLDETDLPKRGLQRVFHQGIPYWVPVRKPNVAPGLNIRAQG